MLRRLRCRPVLLAVVAAQPGIAAAEEPPVDAPTIIVTGSRIPRHDLTATSPVTVIDDKDIALTGTTNIEELLNELPQVAPTQGAFLSNGATGTATVDLRSLGPPRTLVLINGHRVGSGDPTQPVADLNLIPSTLISRVEILTGGASSVYGSAAVSGVINFILDTHLDGIRVDGQVSAFQHDNATRDDMIAALDRAGFSYPSGNTVDGGRANINASVGTSFLDGRGHIAVYGGYREQQALTQESRDYSACAAQVRRNNNTFLACGGSVASAPANFFTNFEELHTAEGRTFGEGTNPFNYAPYNYYQRPDRRYTAGVFADIEISDALKPYLEAMYLNDRSVAQIAPSGDFEHTTTINCDNPMLSAQQRDHVCFTGNYVGEFPNFDDDGNLVSVDGSPTEFVDPVTGNTYYQGVLYVDRRNVEGGARQQNLQHKTFRLLGGASGAVGQGITYDASYLYSDARMSSTDTHFFSVPRMVRALDVITDPATGQPACRSALTGEDPACAPWDIFADGGVTRDAVDYLDASAFRHGYVTEQVANFNATMNFGEWGLASPWSAEAPSVNLGAEYRDDKLVYEPDPQQFTGDLAGAGSAQLPVHGSTTVKELFAETRIPIVEKAAIDSLALEAGYRRSWYSNSQSKVASDAYKLAIEFAPVRDAKVRASLQRAVRAPNIVELFTPAVEDAFDDDPCAGLNPEATLAQCQNTGVTPEQYGHIRKAPSTSFNGYNSIIGGNPGLDAETATTKTLGIVLQPRFIPGFTASVDWWDINLKGAVADFGAQSLMDTCIQSGDPAACGRIHRDSGGSLWLTDAGYIDDRYINIGGFKVRGIDVSADYHHSLGAFGSAELSLLGGYYDHWIVDPGELADSFDCAGYYGGDCGIPQPRWKHKARFTWTSNRNVSLSVSWRYTGPMNLTPIPGYVPGPYAAVLKAQNYFDLVASARFGRNYQFRVGVNNLFDREPPLVPNGNEGACGGGCNGNTYPQWYDPLGRYVFAGFTVELKHL